MIDEAMAQGMAVMIAYGGAIGFAASVLFVWIAEGVGSVIYNFKAMIGDRG